MLPPDTPFFTVLVHLLQILAITGATLGLAILPGWRFARLITSERDTALLLSGMISFLLVYLSSFTVYLCNGNPKWAVGALGIVSVFSVVEMLKRRSKENQPDWRLVSLWYSATLAFTAIQLFIFAPGAPGGMWDWIEHWQRAKVFLENQPLKSLVGGYSMAARGPLFNTFSAQLMALFSNSDYWCYQLVATALNTWFVIPAAIALRRFCGISSTASLVLAACIPLASQDVIWSILYPWTKIFVAGITLGAFVVYLRGIQSKNRLIEGVGLTGFSIAFLSHYLAFPFAVFIWGHYALTRIREDRSRLKTAFLALLASAGIVSSWFLPCFASLGIKQSLSANTTIGSFYVTTKTGDAPSYPKTLVYNTVATFLPSKAIDALGMSRWIPLPADFLKWWVVVWHDGKQMFTKEMPELSKPPFFSGLLGTFGNAGAGVALGVLFAALILKIHPSRAFPYLGTHFWLLFWTLGIVMNAATLRFFCPGGINGIIHTHLIVLVGAVLTILYRLPTWLCVPAIGVLISNVLLITLRTVYIQSLPLPFVDNQPQVAPNTKVFVWHIQNSGLKAQTSAKLLYDWCNEAHLPLSVLTLTAAITLGSLAILSVRVAENRAAPDTKPL